MMHLRKKRRNARVRRKSTKRISPVKQAKGKIVKKIFLTINILLFAILLYFVHFFFFSGYYDIKNIQVQGLQFISSAEFLEDVQVYVDNQTFLGIPNKNILFFNKKKLHNHLSEKYLFSSITTKKKLPSSLTIAIQERQVTYRVVGVSHEYLVDNEGVVVKRVLQFKQRPSILSLQEATQKIYEYQDPFTKQENDPFINIGFTAEESVGIGQSVFSERNLTFLQEVIGYEGIQDVTKIRFDQTFPQSFYITFDSEWYSIVNTNDTFSDQMKRLELVLAEQIGESNHSRIEYVDLRLGNSIFYKFK